MSPSDAALAYSRVPLRVAHAGLDGQARTVRPEDLGLETRRQDGLEDATHAFAVAGLRAIAHPAIAIARPLRLVRC